MPHSRKFAALASAIWLALPTVAAAECKVANYGTLPVEVIDQRATTMASVNGKDTRFILDTGASFGFMARANVEAMGLKREPAPFGLRMGGIGGSFDAEITRVKSLGLLGTTLTNIEFLVGGSDAGMGLIGANLLDIMDADIDLANGRLRLLKPTGCGNLSMAYWSKDGQYSEAALHPSALAFDRRSFVNVMVGGKPVRALLDTGAPATIITRRAAERVGINLSSANAEAPLSSGGLGQRRYKAWVVPIDSYEVGTERVQHSKIKVMDGEIGTGADAPEMLLGIDFFLAHHVFIANSQSKIYFSYNGGRVFTLADAPKPAGAVPPAADQPAKDQPADKPLTAADYALRGQARLSRGEVVTANADLDAAVNLAPDNAAYHLARARARLSARKQDEAMADLGTTIRLDNQNLDALLLRARLRFARRDKDAAEQDVEAARKLAPTGSSRARELAGFYVAIDRPQDALPLLDDWVRLHPDDSALADVLNARCWARGLANTQLEGALADCTRAIKANRERGAYYDSLGLVHLRMGQNAEAEASYAKALALMPRSPWSHLGLGMARQRQGQTAEGDKEMAEARAILPDIETRARQFGLMQ